MPSLKDLRNRITSVKATRKITKAMQMVAAAKLRRAQEAATAARPYADRMDQMIASLGARITDKGATPLLSGTGRDQVHLMVVMTGERGLAGGFNTNISKLARQDAQRLLAARQDREDADGRPQGRRGDAPRVRHLLRRSRRSARHPPDRLRERRRDRAEAARALRGRRVRRRHALLLASSRASSRRSRRRCSSSRPSCPPPSRKARATPRRSTSTSRARKRCSAIS